MYITEMPLKQKRKRYSYEFDTQILRIKFFCTQSLVFDFLSSIQLNVTRFCTKNKRAGEAQV